MIDFSNIHPLDAARVTNWMPAPQQTRHWRINRYNVDEEKQGLDEFREVLRAERMARLVGSFVGQRTGLRRTPVGQYTVLAVRSGKGWQAVMSDTPNELDDHLEFIDWARGRVLVHGLGLGCVVAALLAKPEVEHIDVVEKDAEVIELTGDYYAGERCTIHHDDCMTKVWPRGTRWDCAWHDIWFLISPDNLTDDSTAEHGVSYATLHRKFGNRVGWQMSWAWHIAREMRDVRRREERYAERWSRRWNAGTQKQRVEMMIEHQANALGVPVGMMRTLIDPPAELKRQMAEMNASANKIGLQVKGQSEGGMIAQYRRAARWKMTPDKAYDMLFTD